MKSESHSITIHFVCTALLKTAVHQNALQNHSSIDSFNVVKTQVSVMLALKNCLFNLN